ncbi:hypothetical protein GCM10016455_01290 [Aliiroseovarius zhejiangensis]|uniref:Uncharacterized protein n=1 Tax=Aliiroseovarius zhejiangensis TaxID=1632025 RepID=A0ABQ3IMN9_9RHOB|nr:hypothetical protein GCM10016455_01290 [Aliiroseovarius zhejiangensis]
MAPGAENVSVARRQARPKPNTPMIGVKTAGGIRWNIRVFGGMGGGGGKYGALAIGGILEMQSLNTTTPI